MLAYYCDHVFFERCCLLCSVEDVSAQVVHVCSSFARFAFGVHSSFVDLKLWIVAMQLAELSFVSEALCL